MKKLIVILLAVAFLASLSGVTLAGTKEVFYEVLSVSKVEMEKKECVEEEVDEEKEEDLEEVEIPNKDKVHPGKGNCQHEKTEGPTPDYAAYMNSKREFEYYEFHGKKKGFLEW